MSNKKSAINLLPQEEFDASLLGRTLKWAMGSFRIIVILTEMVVMAAFLSRFWLDAQNSSLNDSIKIASAQISTQSKFEKEFRGVQKKLNIYKQIMTDSTQSGKIDSISSKIPGDLILSSISIQGNLTQIKGTSGSEMGVAQFITNLKADPSVKKVDLDSIGSKEQNQSLLTFLISVSY
jgi:Tfp pilus assembly protein PilN